MIVRRLKTTLPRNKLGFRESITRSRALKSCASLPPASQQTPLRFNICSSYLSTMTSTTTTTETSIENDDTSSLILSLPAPFLRNMHKGNYDTKTHQRTDVLFDVHNGKLLLPAKQPSNNNTLQKYSIRSCELDEATAEYTITFGDGLTANYSLEWVQATLQRWQHPPLFSPGRILWHHEVTESMVRQSSTLSLDFDQILTSDGMKTALRALYQYGIVLVRDTPIDDGGAGVAALGAALSGGCHKNSPEASLWSHYQTETKAAGTGSHALSTVTVLPHGTDGPLRTLYGVVWSTAVSGQAKGSSVADSAYGHDALPLHTDMSYHQDPPGLQIFTMRQPAPRGGESVFADGFAVAQRLKRDHPKAFDTLSTIVRTYYCIDHVTGWHLQAKSPVITIQDGVVTAIRHNDLDRRPDLPPAAVAEYATEQEISEFYAQLEDAHETWDKLLSQDEFRLVINLQRGETIVVANQRCLHGRYDFDTYEGASRAVMGCYISQDDLNSRFRMEGFDV